jgi:GR25 family glycosyltransferase involved in LPS biosynthesis
MIKAFIIRKPGDELSERLSTECVESAAKFGIIVEKFDGVYSDHDKIMAEHGVFCFPKIKEAKKENLGIKGCLMSHYLLWKKSIDLNEPIIIFEHDALMIRPLPVNILELFTHHCILDYAVHDPNYEDILAQEGPLTVKHFPRIYDDSPSYRQINKTHIRGSHAHIVTPLGAKTLIESVKKFGHLSSDSTVNQMYTEFITIDPIPVRCHPFFSNKKNRRKYSHIP